MKRLLKGPAAALTACLAAACGEADNAAENTAAPIRGLITMTVGEAGETTRRRYPGVLEPEEITSLSFEVGGKLTEVDLSVGQRVKKGDILAQLDSAQFKIEIENKAAAVDENKAILVQDEDDLRRAESLLKTGAGTRLTFDEATTDVRTSRAKLRQAEEALKSAREDLNDAVIYAPFDGIINSVDADSFATVASGATIASIYEASAYEVSFSVNFGVVSALKVGAPALVRLADDPSIVLKAEVSELGERADTVSSFPVVVAIKESHPLIRAGMAVEVNFELELVADVGYLIPVSAAIPEGQIPDGAGPTNPTEAELYVFDPETSTVKRRTITMAGLRDNRFLVIDGLKPGEKVAIAGVTFLREGMKVKPIEAKE